MKRRRPIPAKVKDRLMVANRHTCCICNESRHPVEKHHINEDPADNSWNNLAVLCRNCHGLVTQRGNLGANYSPGEVLQFKLRWEKRCSEATAEEIDAPLEEIQETIVIAGGEHEYYAFDMKRGEELVFSLNANGALDLVICHEEDIDDWTDGVPDDDDEDDPDSDDDDDADDHPLPDGYWHKTGVMALSEEIFVAPKRGRYVLLLVNWDAEATTVSLDAALWSAD